MNVVYFAQRNGRIKIGTTGDLRPRLTALGVTLLAAEPGSYKKERELHERFAADRIEGEWFRPSRTLLDYIVSLPPLPAPPPEALMDNHAVVAALRVSARTVNRWAIEGLLPYIRTPGGRRRFRRSDVEALMKREAA